MTRFGAIRATMALALTILPVTPVHAQFWQCVTFARSISAIDLRGNAKTWWAQAAGRYLRDALPTAGSVMTFKPSGTMPQGHVAVVREVVSAREVLLDHANWSRPGRVERGVRAVDVSAKGDWSVVRVFYAGAGGLGTRVNALYGFIKTAAQSAS
ncbi:Peptidase C51 domain-containing protein [Sphingomonas antarctica]|uniref:CHAP domain-containing protein n=1 Tax=Sphingomonas antarctica TaxID=2040274 RepID=UPI0039EA7A47